MGKAIELTEIDLENVVGGGGGSNIVYGPSINFGTSLNYSQIKCPFCCDLFATKNCDEFNCQNCNTIIKNQNGTYTIKSPQTGMIECPYVFNN